MPEVHYGGSFACPLTDELLAKYELLIEDAEQSIKEAMLCLLHCCEEWWNLPESVGTDGKPHPSGQGRIIPLDDKCKAHLDEHIPWGDELKAYAERFDKIDNETHKELRDAAFHLLWHVMELNLDREPITTDKL